MSPLEQFFTVSLLVQIIHSIEELVTGFHKKWYLFKMPFWIFFLFEIVFSSFWIVVWLWSDFPNRLRFQTFFLILMFVNGVQHLVWAAVTRKYVPGLITAPIHVIVTGFYFFSKSL